MRRTSHPWRACIPPSIAGHTRRLSGSGAPWTSMTSLWTGRDPASYITTASARYSAWLRSTYSLALTWVTRPGGPASPSPSRRAMI